MRCLPLFVRKAIALLLMLGQLSPVVAQVIADPNAPANQRANPPSYKASKTS